MNLQSVIHGIALPALLLMAPGGQPTAEASLEGEFQIAPGQAVSVRNETLKVRFESVIADSRCPKGEQCISAGNAEILIQLEAKGLEAKSFRLNTSNEPREVDYGGYGVRLVTLDPVPIMNRTVDPAKYLATLLVRKA
jgi:hypothetical protein